MNFFPIYRYLMFFPVHFQIITLKDFFFLFLRNLVTLSERHTDSGQQFAHIKRFCHIIICPQIQCLFFFLLFLFCFIVVLLPFYFFAAARFGRNQRVRPPGRGRVMYVSRV